MAAPEPAPLRRLASRDVGLPIGVTSSGTAGKILQAGLTEFAERGYYGASIRDIARAAGVSSATLYDHHPSKEHLLAELVRLGHDEHHRRLREALLEVGSDPDEQLDAVVTAHVHAHADLASLAVVANSELHVLSPALAGPALALRGASERLLLDVIERGVRLGRFHVEEPYLALAAIGAMGIRVAHWLDGTDDHYTPAVVARHYSEFARRIVGSEGSSTT